MTKARDLANLLDGNGDVNTANLANVPASNDASALTTGTLPNARLPNNISDGGTTGTKVASGNTAQRGTTAGEWRYNSSTGFFEGRNTDGSFSTLVPDPTVSSVDDTEIDSGGGGNQTLVITGTNFASGGVISFIGTDSSTFNATSTTFNSATQVTVVVPKSSFINSKEPYDVKMTNADGKTALLENVINIDNTPNWSTSAGSVGTVLESSTISTIQLSATDPDGDSVTYAETGSYLSSIGLSLSSSGAITGYVGSVSGNTTTAFTVRATAGSKTTDRNFSITVANVVTQALLWDATNLGTNTTMPSSNGNGLGGLSVNTAVTLSNVRGASGTMASGFYLRDYSDTWSHYTHNDGRNSTIGDTFWSSTVQTGHSQTLYSSWFGSHNGGSHGNTDMWFTMDYGANPSFKIKKLTGYTEWRTGDVRMYFYGTNNLGSLNGNAGGSDAGGMNNASGMTELVGAKNIMSTGWDTGYFTNNTFFRYYVIRCVVFNAGVYDWGLQRIKYYGDYY